MRAPLARYLLPAALAMAAVSAPLPAAAQSGASQGDPASATVAQLDDALLGIMKSHGTDKSRAVAIAPAIDRAFDLGFMARYAVGPSWNTIAPADQQALVAAFRRLTIAQYAGNFDGFSGESFAIAPQVEVRGTDRLVRTTLAAPGKAPIAIAYRLRQAGASWKIIDIFYKNAISQLAMRRSDFAGVLAKGGAKALIAHLDVLSAKGSF